MHDEFMRRIAGGTGEQREAAFEERAVKELLRWCGVPLNIGRAKADAARLGGGLSFEWLRQTFPEYTVITGAAKVPDMRLIDVESLFGRFTSTPLFKAFLEWQTTAQADDRSQSVAFIFNWPDIGMMAMHNLEVVESARQITDDRDTRIVRPIGNPPVVYVIERLRKYAERVKAEFQYGDAAG